jgi:hypothetical protein
VTKERARDRSLIFRGYGEFFQPIEDIKHEE